MEAENIMMEIDTETENVQMDLLSAREFLTNSTLTEARASELKTSCENHSKEMLSTWKKVNNIKLNEFMKTYKLSEAAKGYVKEEFNKFNIHILTIQKAVNNEMAAILKLWQEEKAKEVKPAPAVQPSGTGTGVYEMEYNPMKNYNNSK